MARNTPRPHQRQRSLTWLQGLLLRTLWASGHTLATATTLLGNLNVVGTAWSAAAAGWLLAELMPFAVRAVLEALSIARKARLEAERARLVQAWGLEGPQETLANPKQAV